MSIMDMHADHSKQSFNQLVISVSKELSLLLGTARYSLDEFTDCVLDIVQEQPTDSRTVAQIVETHGKQLDAKYLSRDLPLYHESCGFERFTTFHTYCWDL